ncbi:hypothetical protein BDV28DRAFT_149186 [Aspergillus coremiiformis]|uniref:Uncharacterized protein n=1 Tax=Aspergillus coremiiformis TaxID=138285 RepID=A0A5N6Z562_9EURO|nr:hypothetical protein BDV28DRAFT_149186 [Aspergillus coremiiformis]
MVVFAMFCSLNYFPPKENCAVSSIEHAQFVESSTVRRKFASASVFHHSGSIFSDCNMSPLSENGVCETSLEEESRTLAMGNRVSSSTSGNFSYGFFPMPIGLGVFDDELVKEVATIITTEA